MFTHCTQLCIEAARLLTAVLHLGIIVADIRYLELADTTCSLKESEM